MAWTDFGRRAGKALAAGALHYTGARALIAGAVRLTAGGRRMLIVSYHRVVEDFEAETREAIPGLLISERTFRRHLEELTRGDFEVVTLERALEVMAGRVEPRRDVAVITFDDGYRDVYYHAFPVLRRMGLPAIVYLASGLVGSERRFVHDQLYSLLKRALEGQAERQRGEGAFASAQASALVERLISRHSAAQLVAVIETLERALGGPGAVVMPPGEILSWEMAREMAAAGIDFGSHTVDHVVLTHEREEEIDRQVALSKSQIEAALGRPVVDFAYPNGYYDRRVVEALARHGYRSAATTEDLPNRAGGNPFLLKRKTLWENFSRGLFGYSTPLTACHLDDVFSALALARPTLGERPCRNEPVGSGPAAPGGAGGLGPREQADTRKL